MAKKVALLILPLIFFPRVALAHWGYYGYRFPMWPSWGFWYFGRIMMGFLWVVLIAGIVYLFWRSAGGYRHTVREDPLEILKKRYARGEISREEYERIKKDLEL